MRRQVRALLLALTTLALFVGCDGGVATDLPSAPAASPVPVASAPDPAVREAVSAYPSFDVGHTVHLTNAGIQPRALASLCCTPVEFRNETGKTLTIVFTVYKIKSGPIAPGASWSWTPPNPEAVGYHLLSDPSAAGSIQVESPDW